jgi:hypothetical protein
VVSATKSSKSFVGRAAAKRVRRPRVLGLPLPRDLVPRNLSMKKVAKQVENVAEQLEARSEDVRMLSAQAKRLSKKLS